MVGRRVNVCSRGLEGHMVQVSFLRPIDQFSGARRILQDLKDCFQSDQYNELVISVAFAKTGPLLRMASFIGKWRKQRKRVRAIIGIDMNGTSKQALEFALASFDETYITHSTSHSTFHPKFYLFFGADEAICYQGSHNLTVGGTETNLEGGAVIRMALPADDATFQEALSCWTSLLPDDCNMTKRLDRNLLDELVRGAYVFDEKHKPPKQSAVETSPDGSSQEGVTKPSSFPRTFPRPPSSLPKDILSVPSQAAGKKAGKKAPILSVVPPTAVASEALVIQIVPHHNGEVFLSKQAVNQQPSFFGYPFTGKTVPKRAGNPSYPQRVPDPVVNITVYDRQGNNVLTKLNFNLNTVLYELKSEIRITFSPDLLRVIDNYSVMVMRQTAEAHDYDIEIHNPGSQRYDEYLNVCNQTLPSGGAAQSRRMGWL
jgi:hypothetical protein